MKKRYALLVLLCLLLLMLNLGIGSVRIPPLEILQILRGAAEDEAARDILLQLRFPRAAAAAILGGALALAGYLLQTYFHNPIAGPFILGISSGAKLAVAAVMVFSLEAAFALSSRVLILAALAGALLSMGFVLLMARAVKGMPTLLVSGVMIGYICSAVTDLIVTFASDADIVNLHNWSKGSFSGMSWENVKVMSAAVLLGLLGSVLLSKPMGAYQLGEEHARSVGVNVRAFRASLVLLSSLLAGCVTAFAGPVSFVGIAVPQLVRAFFRTSRPLCLIPACFLGGSAFCLFCDLLARTMLSPSELSISTVTALFGAPVVIAVLLRKRREEE